MGSSVMSLMGELQTKFGHYVVFFFSCSVCTEDCNTGWIVSQDFKYITPTEMTRVSYDLRANSLPLRELLHLTI